jgi:hypothetical protein
MEGLEMTRNDQLIIKLEFDNIIKYLDKRGDELTVGEVMQEIGALRMFIFNMGTTN